MAVTIPSDLIAGVLKAAAPKRAEAATLKLAGLQPQYFDNEMMAMAQPPARHSGDLIMDVLAAANPLRLSAAERGLSGSGEAGVNMAQHDGKIDAYRKFEAFLLSSAFENILPDAESGAFGEGFAGGVWRSMAAEQFASLFADQGGIGVAELLASRDQPGKPAAEPNGGVSSSRQWPYFQTSAISAFQT